MKEKCKICRFYDPSAEKEKGYCRRYAPKPRLLVYLAIDKNDNPDAAGNEVIWPLVHEEDFCGDFQPKPVRQSSEPI